LREAEKQRRIAQAKSPPPMLTKLRDVRLRQPQRPLKIANENT
jgi:hypothetical protein